MIETKACHTAGFAESDFEVGGGAIAFAHRQPRRYISDGVYMHSPIRKIWPGKLSASNGGALKNRPRNGLYLRRKLGVSESIKAGKSARRAVPPTFLHRLVS